MKTKMKLLVNALVIMAFILGSNCPLYAQNYEQIYQKGLIKEEGEGELQDAIDLYNQIADNSNAEKSLQAKALLHIGMCYEKMGNQEATKAYQRLVNNFPGQKSEVAIARVRLSRLILITKKKERPVKTKDLLIRKVLADTEIEPLGGLSPDGKHISFVDWKENGNLSILNLETNKKQRLTDFKDPIEQAYYSSWSPDGGEIAYLWWDKIGYNISIVDINETNSRDILKSDYVNWIELGNWSSDGRYIIATMSLRAKPESQIVLISTTDGSVKILKTYEKSYLGGKPWLSPNGRYVAYDLPDDNASGNSDIHIFSILDKQDKPLFKHPSHDYILGWTPKGNNILFASDRTGTVDAMIIKVKEGKSIDQPKMVQSNIGPIIPMGFTQKDSYVYGEWSGEQNIYITEIDFEKGKVLTKPILAVKRFEGKNGSPSYSNNGEFIAYVSQRGVLRKGKPGIILCIRNLKTGKEHEIIPPTDLGGSISHPTWSPDDNSLALMLRVQNGRQEIYNYNIQTKEFSPLVKETNIKISNTDYVYPNWSPDGKTIYYFELSQNNQSSYIKARNIETGNDRVLFQKTSENFKDRFFDIALSPDGKWISAINRGENRVIKLISTEGKASRNLYTFKYTGGQSFPQTWSEDGKHIIYACKTDKWKWDMIQFPVDGGEKMEIEMNMFGINSPNLHPDGKHLIFSSTGYSIPQNNIWVMENFLPQEKVAIKAEAKEPEGIRITQISKESYLDDLGTVSSDGKYLSCVDWGTGDLAIRNLSNGEKQLLTDNATLEEDPQKFVIGSAISKNGKLVAYSWWRPYHTYDLHIFDTEKNTSKLLFKEEGVEVYPLAWLSDEKLVTIRQNRNKETTQITLFNVFDGTFQNLKSFDNRQWAQLCTSPDGEYIAYNTIGPTSGNSDIKILTADGKFEFPLVAHPANDKVIGWIPGRKVFLFVSDRSGTWDLWALPVINGKPAGEAQRLFTEFGEVAPIGITEKGDCFFGFSKRNFNAYIIPVNKTTGKPDEKSGMPLAGSFFSINWSPDGQHMASVKQSKHSFELILQDINSGNERRLAKELVYALGPYWSSDGNSVYIFGMDQRIRQKGYKGGIYTVDIETGKINENFQISEFNYTPSVDDALPISGHEVSADNQKIYLLFQNDWIVERDLNTGKEFILYRHPNFERGVFQLSPDGKKLLFAINNKGEELSRLMTMTVKGEDIKELCVSQDAKISGSAFWSPNGKFVYFAERPEGTSLWRVSSEGGIPEKVWHTDKRAESFAIHPSGKEISYTVRERTTEIRVVKGLIQELDKIYGVNE